jgi:hypothetical protein
VARGEITVDPQLKKAEVPSTTPTEPKAATKQK